MNLKQYTAQPDPGLFDTIQRRLRRRRLLRRAGVVAAVALVAGVAALLVVGRPDATVAGPQMAALQPDARPVIAPAAPASQPAAAVADPVQPQPAAAASSDPSHSNLQPPTSALRAPAPKSEVETTDVNLWAPNVIIPDGDQEENRTFSLRFSDEVTGFKLYIFNRNGRQVAYSNDPAYRWDATHSGTRLPQGTYVWVAQFRDSHDRPVQKKGTVTVRR